VAVYIISIGGLEYYIGSLTITIESLDVTIRSLTLTNTPLYPLFGPLLYTWGVHSLRYPKVHPNSSPSTIWYWPVQQDLIVDPV
jgi:hypothetical protein